LSRANRYDYKTRFDNSIIPPSSISPSQIHLFSWYRYFGQ